jgi:hypothetical protein
MTVDHTQQECLTRTSVREPLDRPPILDGWLAAERVSGSDLV